MYIYSQAHVTQGLKYDCVPCFDVLPFEGQTDKAPSVSWSTTVAERTQSNSRPMVTDGDVYASIFVFLHFCFFLPLIYLATSAFVQSMPVDIAG